MALGSFDPRIHAAWSLTTRKGDDMVGKTHRAQIYQFELFELILLLKSDTLPCRAIRGNSISVNSTLPPLDYVNTGVKGIRGLDPSWPLLSRGEISNSLRNCKGASPEIPSEVPSQETSLWEAPIPLDQGRPSNVSTLGFTWCEFLLPVSVQKKHSSRASLCPAIQLQKLLSRPWFGAPRAYRPICPLPPRHRYYANRALLSATLK